MLTRRTWLLGAAATGLAGATGEPVSAHASQPSTRVQFDVPNGACDCHVHVIGNPAKYPFAAERVYTPEPASVEELEAAHRALHTPRTVVVQPSVYGTDNRCMLDAVKAMGPRARGICVIDDKAPDRAIDALDHVGIRGVRINLETVGQTDPGVGRKKLQDAIRRLNGRRWHIQVYTRLSIVERVQDLVQTSGVPVVFDHFGGAQASLGPTQPGFAALVGLVRSGHAYVKISGAYRASTEGPDYRDVAPLAVELIGANADRILWGTDWPHVNSAPPPGGTATDVSPLLPIDDGRLLNQLAAWAPDPAVRRKILVDNPARLYGFESGGASR
jgi:predicted TIM-barrel fold metal-dependent hydrolase